MLRINKYATCIYRAVESDGGGGTLVARYLICQLCVNLSAVILLFFFFFIMDI